METIEILEVIASGVVLILFALFVNILAKFFDKTP